MGTESTKKNGEEKNNDDLVLTPGGWRPKSKVFHVKPGYHVDFSGGKIKIVHTATGEVIADLGEIAVETPAQPEKDSSGTGASQKKKKQTSKK